MKKVINKLKKQSYDKYIIYIILISLFVCSSLINKIPLGHDVEFHMTNYIQLANNFSLKNIFFSKLYTFENIANGFGYGTRIFYPPISYLLTTFIYQILKIFNIKSALTISYYQIIVLALSGIAMYKLVKNVSKNEKVAFLSSISYITQTYFLCDIFVRTALAEELIFLFMPIIFDGLYELFYGEKNKFYLKFVIGYVGLINSHLVLSVYLTIIILLIFIINIKKIFKKEYIFNLLVASFYILLISSPFLVPLIEHKFGGNYAVFEENIMYSNEQLKDEAIKIYELFKIGNKTTNGIKVYFNYSTLLMLLLVIFNYQKIFKKEIKYKKIVTAMILIIVLSLVVSNEYFPWEIVPNFLKNIQFPWRMCTFSCFAISFLSGFCFKLQNDVLSKSTLIILIFITIVICLNVTTDTYLVDDFEPASSLGVQQEYFPKKINNNLDYYSSRENNLIILKGEATWENIKNKESYLNINISDVKDNTIIELPRIYYLGYKITLTKDNKKTIIPYSESPNGFVEIELNENGLLEADYIGTKMSHLSYLVSLVAIILLVIETKKMKGR